MKRFVKFTSLLLAILTVLPCIPVFAADLSESVSLVENGLAAHYDASNNTGDGHDATAEVLADLAGENDIALTLSESVSFTEDALRISAAQVEFPEAILDIVNGSEFTVEMKVGTIAAIGSSYTTMINSANDNFALFLRTAGDLVEFKNGSNGRPTVPDGKNLVENSTITLTFSLTDRSCVMYVDGHERGRAAASSLIGANAPFFFGHTGTSKAHTADYRAFRFYTRALSAKEVAQNAKADGTFDESYIPSKDYTKTAQTALDTVGDLALVQWADSQAKLTALTSAKQKPAVAIYYLDSSLKLTDKDGKSFASLQSILTLPVVPAFYIRDAKTVTALQKAAEEIGLLDFYVISDQPSLVKAARQAMPLSYGAIDLSARFEGRTYLTDLEQSDIRRLVNVSLAKVVILPESVANKEDIDALNKLQLSPWIMAKEGLEKQTDALTLLLSSAHGIVSDNTALLVSAANELLKDNTLLRSPVNIGHRGTYASIAKAPENTLENAIVAYENGANALEIDVFMTKDGVIVLHHDSGTGTGKMKKPDGTSSNWSIENNNWSFLSTLYYTGYTETDENGDEVEYTGFHISTLESLLKEFKGKDVQLVIEIKSSKEAIVPELKRLIDAYDMYDQSVIICFPSFGLQDDLMTYFPELPVGTLLGVAAGTEPETVLKYTAKDSLPVNAVPDVNYSGYGAGFVRAASHRGITVWGWTINNTASIYSGLLDGLSGITTDNAHVLGALAKSVTATTPYWVAPGSALKVDATVTAYNRTAIKDGAFLVILEGEELIASADGMSLQLNENASGSITYMVGYTQSLGEQGEYTLYCQPVTVLVSENEQTAPAPEKVTEPALLTLIGDGSCFYNETAGDAVSTVLEFAITLKDGSSAKALFENKASYLWELTANGKSYTVTPASYDEKTGEFTFLLTKEQGFVPAKDTLYTLSLALYQGQTVKYRSANELIEKTPADLMNAHSHVWSNAMSYIVRPSNYESGIGYYPCTVCGAKSETVTLPKVNYTLGDVNFDGRSSISDVTALLNYLSASAMEQTYMLKTGVIHQAEANFDCDIQGTVALTDVTALLNYLAGDKPTLPSIEQDGLVAWYEGSEHTDTLWTDKKGDNDISITAGSFENGALVLENQQVTLPSAVYDAVRGSEYTIELNLGAFATVYATSGYCTWLCNNGSEQVSLFITNSDGKFAAKISDQTSAGRPSLTNATEKMQNATIAITYKTSGKAILYVNGVEVSSKSTAATNGNSKAAAGSTFILGNSTSTKVSTTEFQGLRFYSRALTAEEIAENAAYDMKNSPLPTVVKDGLAAWYDGEIYDGKTWVDLTGRNDIETTAGAFEKGAFHLPEGTEQKLPKGLVPALQGEDYTIELNLGAFEATGTSYTTWLCNLPSGNSEVLSLYIENLNSKDTFYGKVSGLSRGARPNIAKASGALQNATITITYETGGNAILYVNGRKISTMSAATTLKHGGIAELVLGAATATNSGNTYFEGLRIYDRALSAAEVRRNVAVDNG